MLFTGLTAFAFAFVLSYVATLFMRQQALRTGFVDVPSERKDHGREIPLGGGQAMYFTFAFTILTGYVVTFLVSRGWNAWWLPPLVATESEGILSRFPQVLLILAGGVGMTILGWIDDVKDLSAGVKLVFQIILASIPVAGGVSLTFFIPDPTVAKVVTVLWIVTVVNAFNFLDNMDGLCAGVALVAGGIFAIVAAQTNQVFVTIILLVYMGMLLGFLIFNFHPASIFMGDAGSFIVGYIIAVLTVVFTYRVESGPVHAVLTPLLILALPLYDMVYVVGSRLLAGKQLYVGDHSHVSHRLADLGMSPKVSVLTIYLITFCSGLAAIMLRQMDEWGALCAVGQVLCFLILISLIERTGRKA